MPFNGSGTYNLPAGNPVVTGTPISSTTTNSTNSDIANALTNCLTRDGQSSPTSAIPMSNQKLTGLAKGTIAGDAMRFEQTAQIDETTGENSNIKSITGLTTPLSASQGGTGASSATGTGSNVLSNSPTLVTPALGTPASGNLANCTFPVITYSANLTGGSAGKIPYQSGANTTSFTAAGTAGQVLYSNGTSAPTWGTAPVTLGTGYTFAGTSAGANVTTPVNSNNSFYGYLAGSGVTGGNNNTCLGGTTGTALGNGSSNTFIGYYAGAASTGTYNTFLGAYASGATSSGNFNTIVGYNAGNNLTSGASNVILGSGAGTDAVANLTTQSNYIVLGTNTITNANIKVAWTVTSDARDKTNFAEIPHGLDFVVQLKPTAYQFKLDRNSDDVGENARVRYGFLAQDVLELEGANPVIINNDEPEHLKYNESSMIPVLVKAIQELTAKVAALEARIA
jgi:hypothetical protein